MTQWTFDRLTQEATRFRQERDDAETRFYVFLWGCKHDSAKLRVIEEEGGYTFADWLETFAIAKPKTYERFERGFRRLELDEERALQIGANAVFEAGKIEDDDEVDTYVGAVTAWRESHCGNFPSKETAARMRHQVAPTARVPKALKQQNESTRLRDENRRLRAENRALRAENRSLAAEVERLQKKGGQKKARRAASRKKPARAV